jgi:MFS family permease
MPTWSVLGRYRQIIKSQTYFPLWLGQLVSNFGDTLNYVALVVLVYRSSGSGLAVSATVIFEIVPLLLLAPVAGVVIDRFPRKAILVPSDLTRAALVLVLVFADATWRVYTVAALPTAASVFFNPTLQATDYGQNKAVTSNLALGL